MPSEHSILTATVVTVVTVITMAQFSVGSDWHASDSGNGSHTGVRAVVTEYELETTKTARLVDNVSDTGDPPN
jgi:hypothetical protein